MVNTAEVKKLKGFLGMDTGSSGKEDVFVEFALETAKENILNYCHIEKIPEGLATTVICMAADIYRDSQYGSADMPVQVTSVKVGDTSTSFGNASAEYAQDLFKKYRTVLNRYRRVVFR